MAVRIVVKGWTVIGVSSDRNCGRKRLADAAIVVFCGQDGYRLTDDGSILNWLWCDSLFFVI